MDPLKKQIDDRTSYTDLDDQFRDARLDKDGLNRGDWPSQIDRAAIDVTYGVALGKSDSAFDYGATIGRNDFGSACGEFYVEGLKALAGEQSDLPQLITEQDPDDLGNLAFRLNELRVELSKLGLDDENLGSLNRATEALVEKLITRDADSDITRQSLQRPEAVSDLLYQLFSDPAVTNYADVLIDAIGSGTGTSVSGETLLEHLDRPQMVTPLWEHQQKAIEKWVKADTTGYVNMATATGKTVLGLAAIAHQFGDLHPTDSEHIPAREQSTSGPAQVLVVAGQDLLLEQWQSEFDEHLNIPRSRTTANPDSNERVIELSWGKVEFRTAQELLATDENWNYNLVILDEAHRYSSGRREGRGWRDLFEDLTEGADSVLAMSGSIDDEWLGDSSVRDALEDNLTECIEFTIQEAREQNVIADFRWDICYAASRKGETLSGVEDSTTALSSVYDDQHHKFVPHDLDGTIPDGVPNTFETLRDLRSFAQTKEGKQAREAAPAFDRFSTAAFSRRPKRWQLSPPATVLGQLLEEHLPERKAVVLVQSYTQAETIATHLGERVGKDLVTMPDQKQDAPYDSIKRFKNADSGVLIGPGEVLGVGVDLPDAGVAINLAKGGVNASLIQRIGRILRNPTGNKKAHFYQMVTVPAQSSARLHGEDGRRLLQRASEFRALGSRFREHPGFVVADTDTSAIIRELEIAGAQAKIEDERETGEIVDDDVAVQLLDEITAEIQKTSDESLDMPVLTTHWQPESLAPGTMPVHESVDDSDSDGNDGTLTTSKGQDGVKIKVTVTDTDGGPIKAAAVVMKTQYGKILTKETTNRAGRAILTGIDTSGDLIVDVSRENYESKIRIINIDSSSKATSLKLDRKSNDTVDSSEDTIETTSSVTKNEGKDTKKQAESLTSSDNDPAEENRRKEMLSLIVDLHDEMGRVPKANDLPEDGPFNRQEYIEQFGGWYEAVDASQLNYREELLQDISEVTEVLGHSPGTVDMDQYGIYDHTDIYNFFDTWDEAKQAAMAENEVSNVDKEASAESANEKDELADDEPTSNSGGQTSSDKKDREVMLSLLVELYDELGRVPKATHIPEDEPFVPQDYVDEFGGWYEALEQTSLDHKNEVLDEIRNVTNKLGRIPTTTEFGEYGRYDSGDAYRHFDTWGDAKVAAGVNDLNEESNEDSDEQNVPPSELAELYEIFFRLSRTVDAVVEATEESVQESSMAAWRDTLHRFVQEGVDSWEVGYGPQQGDKSDIKIGGYRHVYGDGEHVTDFQKIETSSPDPVVQAILDDLGTDEDVQSIRLPIAPDSEVSLPVFVESDLQLETAEELLTEFPEHPDIDGWEWVSETPTDDKVTDDSSTTEADGAEALVDVSGVTELEAKSLEVAGFVSVKDLQDATVDDIGNVEGISSQLALRIKADVGGR